MGSGTGKKSIFRKILSDLVLELLPSFKSRGQETFYVAMLRAEVEKKTKKHYRDKEEWKVALRKLHTASQLIYDEASNSVSLPTETGA